MQEILTFPHLSLCVVVQSLTHVPPFLTPWIAARQAFLPFWSLLKFMSIELVMLFNHLILCPPTCYMSWALGCGGLSTQDVYVPG